MWSFMYQLPFLNGGKANDNSHDHKPKPAAHAPAHANASVHAHAHAPNEAEKIPYPKAIFFIVINEFCERFCFYGLRTILSLYLRDELLFTEDDAMMIYHTFFMLVYFFPLFGAILSDSYLGKFKTILYLSIVYVCGNFFICLSSIRPIGLPEIPFSMTSLFLIALGTGGIKPCVSPFGGDQFVLPQQAVQLTAFFSLFYFTVNAGSVLSTSTTPLVRQSFQCFNDNECYPLAFGIPGILMITAIVIFVLGKPLYKIVKPEGNIVFQVTKCIGHGIKQKFKSNDKVDHWLDRAENKYGKVLVHDVKITLKLLYLFIPPIGFWALFDQQGSKWTFQATRMDGDLGFYTILPDQIIVLNPLCVLIFLPLFTYGIYPALAKCHLLKTPLQRMVCGGILTAASFGMSAIIFFILEASDPVLPDSGECQIRIYNTLDCTATLTALPRVTNVQIGPMGYQKIDIEISGSKSLPYSISGCDGKINDTTGNNFLVAEKETLFFHISAEKNLPLTDNIERNDNGLPKIRTLVNKAIDGFSLTYYGSNGEEDLSVSTDDPSIHDIDFGVYKLGNFNKDLKFRRGGVYTVLVSLDDSRKIQNVELYEITAANSVHILWLVPQFIVMAAGEIMFAVTGLEFSYSQAPLSMKAVSSAAWHLTAAVGNIIVIIIESADMFEKHSHECLLYAGLMVITMIVFAFMAMKYKYVSVSDHLERERLTN